LLSLIIGSVVGLVQHRIKRLLAYSAISTTGFLLLALTINSIESIQSFLFFLLQYSFSNLNVFFILILIGYYLLEIDRNSDRRLLDKNNSPLQLISQLKGFFGINPFLALSLTVGIFSSLAIPPTIGFFAKQTVLSAALQEGYYFLTLIGVLTSVVSAVYYLHIIKVLFFYNSENLVSKNQVLNATFFSSCSSSLTITISLLTLIILFFIFSPTEFLSMVSLFSFSIFSGSLNSCFLFSLATIIPIKTYSNAETDKDKILSEQKNQSGIYMWTNIINAKQYIGSAIDLSNRFSFYYSKKAFENSLKDSKSYIYNALLKYGYSNFSLTILEYCNKEKCIEREDFYLCYLPHEYNILPKAGS
jgi:formate hydrogenlyase subunit 3/multisubunit Na+/H+ antiporter MnhD subunit